MKQMVALLMAAAALASGCGIREQDYKKREQPVAIEDVVMGSGVSDEWTVEMTLRQGSYFDIQHTEPGGEIYDENFRGSYVLDLKRGGQTVDRADLGERNIGKTFEIVFEDYNEDGNPDFSIGEWAGSNYNEFQLYSIIGERLVRIGTVSTSEGKYESDYSIRFEHHENVISTAVYDMDVGKQKTVCYDWNEGEQKFLPREEN